MKVWHLSIQVYKKKGHIPKKNSMSPNTILEKKFHRMFTYIEEPVASVSLLLVLYKCIRL